MIFAFFMFFFFFQAEDGIRDRTVTGVQTCALPISRVVAVCDVNKESSDYSEWGTNEIRDKERSLLGSAFSTWGSWWKGATCGREPARRLVEAYYGLANASSDYQGCNAYVNYRELLEQEKD